MKLLRLLTTLSGASLALGLFLAVRLPAQTPADVSPVNAEQTESTDAAPPAPEVEGEEGLRELGAEPAVEASAPVEVQPASETSASERSRRHHEERVGIGSDVLHAEGESAGTVVAILANAVVDGEVKNEAVAILGDLTINGHVEGEAVNVLGQLTINGVVEGEVVAVLTSVRLGPNAHIKGDFVSVGGRIDTAPGARIDGDIQEIPFLGDTQVNFDWLKAWVKHCLMWGRPLWFGENLGWVWMLVGAALMFYLFVSLVMPGPVLKCARTMEAHPGFSVLSAALSILLVPLAMIVLAVTGVGPLIVMFLMFCVGLFGKVVFFAWLGRRFTRNPENLAAPVAVLIGGLVTIVIYLIPVAGFIFQKLTGFIGTGIVLYSIVRAMQADRAKSDRHQAVNMAATSAPTGVEPPAVPNVESAAGAAGPGVAESAAPRPPFVPLSSVKQLSLLPRAGFWTRLGATLIDVLLVAIVLNVVETDSFEPIEYFPALVGLYHIIMWATKGTTIGGIILGLKVVRLDDRPMDWSVAIVRALGGYISLAILGLGYVWVAFDQEQQSWHDKIAGTTIVRVPKGVSLI